MGNLMIEEGDDTWLVDVPSNKIVNADVIRSGDYVFLKFTKTTFRSNEFAVCRHYKTEQWAFPLCLKSWPWQHEFMNVLVMLGLMSKQRQAEFIEIDRRRADKQRRDSDVEALKKIAARYAFVELNRVIEILETK